MSGALAIIVAPGTALWDYAGEKVEDVDDAARGAPWLRQLLILLGAGLLFLSLVQLWRLQRT